MPLALFIWVMTTLLSQAPAPARVSVDFEFFRTRVQPIFLAKREGHARCVACHAAGTPMRIQPLSPGATMWNEEESRKNFEVVVQQAVTPGSMTSKLLLHPLEEAAGGDFFHNGGKHFNSKNNPEWQTLAAWVRGEKANATGVR